MKIIFILIILYANASIAKRVYAPNEEKLADKIEDRYWYDGWLPYNRGTGRSGCLYQKDFPSRGKKYFTYCVDDTKNATFDQPKINVKAQNCNLFDCIVEEFELEHGECRIVNEYNVIMPNENHRFCARISLPKENIINVTKETKDLLTKDLQDNMQTAAHTFTSDPNANNSSSELDRTICIYHNQYYRNRSKEPNFFDQDVSTQPFHTQKDKDSRLQQFKEFILEESNSWLYKKSNEKNEDSAKKIIIDWWMNSTNSVMPVKWGEAFANKILNHKEKNIEEFNSKITLAIKEQEFNTENDNLVGCSHISMMWHTPPPYPLHLKGNFVQDIKVNQICPINQDGIIDSSSVDSKGCVNSDVENNFINNAIRLSIDNKIPSCASFKKQFPLEYKKMEEIYYHVNSYKCIHINKIYDLDARQNGIIEPCTANNANTCFEPNNYLEMFNNQARLIYSDDKSEVLYDNLMGKKLCALGETIDCYKIWGVNIGPYTDLVVNLKEDLDENDYFKGKSKVIAYSNYNYTFEARINKNIQKDQICIFDVTNKPDERLIKCLKRTKSFLPKIYDCNDPYALNHVSCRSTFFKPSAYIELLQKNVNQNTISLGKVLNTKFFNNSEDNDNFINIGGDNYSLIILDENFMSFNQSNNITKKQQSYEYKNKLEYIDDAYLMGGKFACLYSNIIKGCSKENPEQCILTKYKLLDDLKFSLKDLKDILTKQDKDGNDYGNYCYKAPDVGIKTFATLKLEGESSTINIYKEIIKLEQENSNIITTSCYTHDYKKNDQYVIAPLFHISEKPEDRVLPKNLTEIFYSDKDLIPQDCHNNLAINEEVKKAKILYPNLELYKENEESHNTKCSDIISAYKSINLEQCGVEKNKFIYKIQTKNFDENKCTIRDKNLYENELCIKIPPLNPCESVMTGSATEGYAYWEKANFGEYSQGECINGYEAKNPDLLKRYCTVYYTPGLTEPTSGVLKKLDPKDKICIAIDKEDKK